MGTIGKEQFGTGTWEPTSQFVELYFVVFLERVLRPTQLRAALTGTRVYPAGRLCPQARSFLVPLRL